jgi:DNA-binding NtrC family response regulator
MPTSASRALSSAASLSTDLTLAAFSRVPVLIVADDARTRREYARAIHSMGVGDHAPFIAVSCDPRCIEDRGWAGPLDTSTVDAWLGLAWEGTLFIDDLEKLSPALGAQLAGWLEQGTTSRIPRTRLLTGAASGWSAPKAAQHAFERLYYRINVVRIECPSAVARADELPSSLEQGSPLTHKAWS